MVRIIALTFLLQLVTAVHGQVVIGDGGTDAGNSEVKKDRPVKKQAEFDGRTAVYGFANWSSTFRVLQENEGLYAEPLGKRADETELNIWSYGLGFRNSISKYLFWDGGLAWYRNGESYLYTGTDTMFAYQTYYNYIAMPVRFNLCYGENFQWNIGAGLVPQMFNSYRQEQQWETTTYSKDTETIKQRNGYNSFVLSAVFNAGLTMNFKSSWGLFISPELRLQLNSSYEKTAAYIHKGRAYGCTFGLIRKI